jgi:hypothetical protein
MPLRTPRLIGSVLLGVILCAGSLTYALVSGVPQWSVVFQGALDPLLSAYGGWALTSAYVGLGILLVGGCLAVSWLRATVDYLPLGFGFVSVLVVISLGLPAYIDAQIDAVLSFVMVGLCAVLLAAIFFAAIKDRISRGFRV